MTKTAVVFGASGLIGKQLVYLLCENPTYSQLLVFVRKSLPYKHSKIQEVLVDFDSLDKAASLIQGDVVFCCLGSTMKKAGSREAFKKVDLFSVIQLAKIAEKNRIPSFLVISSIGADSQSRNFYLQVKGEMEKSLLQLTIPNIAILRPSLLLGYRNEFRFGEEFAKYFFRFFGFLFIGKLKNFKGIHDYEVARSMIRLAEVNTGKKIYESKELKDLGKSQANS